MKAVKAWGLQWPLGFGWYIAEARELVAVHNPRRRRGSKVHGLKGVEVEDMAATIGGAHVRALFDLFGSRLILAKTLVQFETKRCTALLVVHYIFFSFFGTKKTLPLDFHVIHCFFSKTKPIIISLLPQKEKLLFLEGIIIFPFGIRIFIFGKNNLFIL